MLIHKLFIRLSTVNCLNFKPQNYSSDVSVRFEKHLVDRDFSKRRRQQFNLPSAFKRIWVSGRSNE